MLCNFKLWQKSLVFFLMNWIQKDQNGLKFCQKYETFFIFRNHTYQFLFQLKMIIAQVEIECSEQFFNAEGFSTISSLSAFHGGVLVSTLMPPSVLKPKLISWDSLGSVDRKYNLTIFLLICPFSVAFQGFGCDGAISRIILL